MSLPDSRAEHRTPSGVVGTSLRPRSEVHPGGRHRPSAFVVTAVMDALPAVLSPPALTRLAPPTAPPAPAGSAGAPPQAAPSVGHGPAREEPGSAPEPPLAVPLPPEGVLGEPARPEGGRVERLRVERQAQRTRRRWAVAGIAFLLAFLAGTVVILVGLH